MMIQFRKELIRLIQQGKKTQTRRKISYSKKGALIQRYAQGYVFKIKNSRFKPDIYGAIRVIDVNYDCLGNISEEDAVKEGFTSRAEFVETWIKLHGEFDRS